MSTNNNDGHPPSPPTTRRRRALFLHGMFVGPKLYQEKLAVDFFQLLQDQGYEVTAPCSPRPNSGPVFEAVKELFPNEDIYPEWFNSQTIDEHSKVFDGLENSLKYLIDFINNEEDAFDVVIGHSQGAMMTSILTLLAECQKRGGVAAAHAWGTIETSNSKPLWKAVVCMNAPNSFETENLLKQLIQDAGTDTTIKTPALHVLGGPSDMTWEGQQKLLAQHFSDATAVVYRHDKGHMIPTDQENLQGILAALTKIMEGEDES